MNAPAPAPKPQGKGITFAVESFAAGVIEGRKHAAAHWKEFGARQEYREFDMDYSKYLAAEQQDKLLTVIARRDGVMIGYLTMFVIPDAHAQGGRYAESAFYYTAPHPMRGMILRGMIRLAVNTLLRREIRFIRFRHRLKQTARPILENLGFEVDELSYSLNVSKWRG